MISQLKNIRIWIQKPLSQCKKTFLVIVTQPVFTSSKLTVETLKQGVKCVQSSKVNNKDTKWRQWLRSGVFIVNFWHISHLVLVFLELTLCTWMPTRTKGYSEKRQCLQCAVFLFRRQKQRLEIIYVTANNIVYRLTFALILAVFSGLQ